MNRLNYFGLLCAVLFAFTFARVYLINHGSLAVCFVVSIALFCTVLMSKSLGCILPLTAKRLGFDPALMASPLITTIVDMASLFVYFTIATSVLGM